MLLLIALTALYSICSIYAHPRSALSVGEWIPSGTGDVRSPCPAMNALSNHGYLPRNGKNIKRQTIIDSLNQILGLDVEFATTLIDIVFQSGIGNPRELTIDLDNLNNHEVIEHDVSLTRDDFNTGNNWIVNKTLVEGLLSFASDGKSLKLAEIGAYRIKRYLDCKLSDPNILYDEPIQDNANAEVATLLCVFGTNSSDDSISLPVLRTLLLEERLPIKEGWVKRQTPLTLDEASAVSERVAKASKIDL